MKTLLNLLWKDARRTQNNPGPLLINLALPLLITALVGLAFGGSSSGKGLGTIKLAVVDEDNSPISNFLRRVLQQGGGNKYIEPRLLNRADALAQIKENQISAIIILPKDFAEDYLKGKTNLHLQLIKNPAQSFHPAIVEELLGVLVEGMNALSQNLGGDMAQWTEVFKTNEMPDFLKLSQIYSKLGERMKAVKGYVSPPLVIYEKETRVAGEAKQNQNFGDVFAYILPGMASMFLLFIADSAIRDLYREIKARTLDRYRTLRVGLTEFVGSKVIFALLLVTVSGFVLFLGSSLVFRFHWNHLPGVVALIAGFGVFAAGALSFSAAFARTEKLADVINPSLIIGMSFIGGAYFPANSLPPIFRDHLSPLFPNYWFIEGIRGVHFGNLADWTWPVLKLCVVGLILMVAAATLFRAQLLKGVKP